MTEKNGQPSMEEILASIRRIIAEEPSSHHNGELRGTPIMLKGDSSLEDAGEFDLPAIFRSSPPPAAERAPLLGRLTDAIRSATTSEPRVNGEETHHAEPEVAVAAAEASYAGLSSLKPRGEPQAAGPPRAINGTPLAHEPAPASSGAGGYTKMASSGGPEEPKRVMAPFKDTHFLRMADSAPASATPSPQASMPAPQPAPVFPPEERPVDFGTIIPGQFDRSSLVSGVPFSGAPAPTPDIYPAHAGPVAMPPPPPLPAEPIQNALAVVAPSQDASGTIEDTTADLLRPMLRQWLADNMPRMVEKALHIEIAESIKAPKKP
ncbi:MAG: DUF2497 domain-containing protein [Hyphomicrobium sp.]|uniref:DUF2497 domain-containing protein n=1 Tax=Hyphomicrobium sp. TaxID=82 RepID=UPI003D0B62F1